MENPFDTVSLSKLPSTQMGPLPNLSDPNLTEFLKQLFPAIDHKRLHSSENMQKLYDLMSNFAENSNQEVFKNIKALMGYTLCPVCNISIDIKHTCEAILCPNCVKNAEYCCKNCTEPLESSFLYALFGITGKCTKCRLVAETKCRHYCFRCLILTPLEEIDCGECKNDSENFSTTNTMCFGCRQSFNVKQDFMAFLCSGHPCCTSCSKKAIETGKCVCGQVMTVAKLYATYKYIHSECSHCKDDFLRTELTIRKCCENPVCPACANLRCGLCTNPTLVYEI